MDVPEAQGPAAVGPPPGRPRRRHKLAWLRQSVLGRAAVGLVNLVVAPFRWFRYRALRYLWACWLTWRYVDEFTQFPAIRFDPWNRFPLRIYKEPGAHLRIGRWLEVKGFPGAGTPSQIFLCAGSRLDIDRTFSIGENVRINLGPGARLHIEGAHKTSFSGLPNSCTVYVKRSMHFGKDMGFSWKTLVMDSDWHAIGGEFPAQHTVIGDHVWVAPNSHILKGARIGANSIVATNSVVLAGDYPERSLLGGTPARVLKTGIPDWAWEWPEEDRKAAPVAAPATPAAGFK